MPSALWPKQSPIADTLDAKGRVIVHSLEYTITYQCTNRCRACNHFTYIQPKHMISIEQFRQDLDTISSYAHCDKFSLIGGECLLHPDLLDLLDIVDESEIGDLVSLTTNGQLIDRFGKELWCRLQRIEFGLYGGKGWTLDKIKRLLDTVEHWNLPAFFGMVGPHEPGVVAFVEQRAKLNPKWQWTKTPGFHPTLAEEKASEIEAQRRFNRCTYGHVCNTLDQGYLYRCPESSFIPSLVMKKDPHLDGRRIDSFDAASFLEFVQEENHRNSCHLCRSLERYSTWKEVPEGITPDEWLNLAKG